MAKLSYPIFGIDNLKANKSFNELLNADRFKDYLSKNPHLNAIHKHSFYHLLYFSKGSGTHIIDFENFPIHPGMIYFMRPGQVHNWKFETEVDGFIINFSPDFFDLQSINSNFIDQLHFFAGTLDQQVISLNKEIQIKVQHILEEIIQEQKQKQAGAQFVIAALLIQLFLTINRTFPETPILKKTTNYNVLIFKNFKQLIEDNFYVLKLPKDYAALLYITPKHLNALSKDYAGISAGEMIRNRVILEAKRLLINFDLTIKEIALELDFPDTSYFVKFFKKHTKLTPESFRNEQNNL